MTTATARRRRGGTMLDRETFAAAFDAASFAVPSRTPNPILRNVLLADGHITGTDMDVQVSVPIDWHEEPLLLPADRMKQILSSTRSDQIGLQPDGNAVIVTAGGETRSRGLWRLPMEPASEYPRWSPEHRVPLVRIAAESVSRSIRSVQKATDQQSSRYAMSGVLVDVRDGVPTFVSTDGRRMYWSTMAVEDQAVDDRLVLIPLRGMQAIDRVASRRAHAEDAVQFHRTNHEVIAEIGGTIVVSRLLDGKFPPWRDLLRENLLRAKPAHAKRSDLESAIRAAAIVSSEDSKGVDFAFSEATLSLTGRSSEYGDSSVSMDLDAGGFAATVKLDPKFVVDWLTGLSESQSPAVEIRGTDGDSAVMFSCEDYRCIVMPLTRE